MTKQDNHSCEVYHFDLYGTREEKYDYLRTHDLNTVEWQQLNPQAPQFFFVPKDFSLQQEYEQGFKIDELMKVNVSGIKTQRDDASVFLSEKEMLAMRNDFLTLSVDELKSKYGFKDVRDWQVQAAKEDIQKNPILADKLCYRPFDIRPMLYTGKTKGIQGYPRYDKMRHLLYGYLMDTNGIDFSCESRTGEEREKSIKGNVAFLLTRNYNAGASFQHIFATKDISDLHVISDQSYVFPLYLYPEQGMIDATPTVNMDPAIMERILLGARSSSPAHDNYPATNAGGDDRAPSENNELAIFDYIYGILHSPTYRAKYKEFLKVDFPRIPYPDALCEGQIGKTFATPADAFEHYRFYGERLRKLHLMEQNTMQTLADQYKDIAIFPNGGSMVVEEVSLIAGGDDRAPNINAGGDDRAPNIDAGGDDRAPSVRINDTQYFANVPAAAWNFYIGGYQPAQKWLKDRKGRTLTFDDIQHYRQIITVLIETARLMAEI